MTDASANLGPRTKVFGLQTAPNLFKKFLWELEQLKHAMAAENYRYPEVTPIYHVFNCTITAWHLTDWVWADATDEQRDKLADRYGFARSGGKNEFAGALCRMFPELAACRDIANGSKHFEVSRSKSSVRVETDFAIVSDPGMSGLKRGDYLLSLHVWMGDRNMTGQLFFDRMFEFWHRLMLSLGMFDEAPDLIKLLPVPTQHDMEVMLNFASIK